jgi:RNA recognition motif-containing protein
MTIYVGNLSYSSTEADLQNLFSRFGEIQSVKLITDRQTGRSRGYGFIEMEDESGQNSINELNGIDFNGRNIRVYEAKERTERPNNERRPPRPGGGDRDRRQQRRSW